MKKIKTWIKLEDHFIDEDNIRAVARLGSQTRIERILGEAVVVKVPYEKVKNILPKDSL